MIILRQKLYTGARAAVRYIEKLDRKIFDRINKNQDPEEIGKLVDKVRNARRKHAGRIKSVRQKATSNIKDVTVEDVYNKLRDENDKNFKKEFNTSKNESEYENKLFKLLRSKDRYVTDNGKVKLFSPEYNKRDEYFQKRWEPTLDKMRHIIIIKWTMKM